MMSKKMEKKAEKMRSPENRKTTMSRIQLHRLARLASLLKRNGSGQTCFAVEKEWIPLSRRHIRGILFA